MPGLQKTCFWGPPTLPLPTCAEGTGQFSRIFYLGWLQGLNVCLDPGQGAEEQ